MKGLPRTWKNQILGIPFLWVLFVFFHCFCCFSMVGPWCDHAPLKPELKLIIGSVPKGYAL